MNRVNILTIATLAVWTSLAVAEDAATATATNAPSIQPKTSSIPGPRMGYFNPARTPEYNPYPYYNLIGGESFASLYLYDVPDQNESPFNPATGIAWHKVSKPRLRNSVVPVLLQPQNPSPTPPPIPQTTHP